MKMTGVALFDDKYKVVGFVHPFDKGYLVVGKQGASAIENAIKSLERRVGDGNLDITQAAKGLWVMKLTTDRFLFPGAPTLQELLAA